ncbi:hypothetical protein, partial [Bifidobacterium longum]|uniref:hypothetical protein n=1 Tax=Bifidobacterium longum TaxID=216816 RepID=UPI001A9557C8
PQTRHPDMIRPASCDGLNAIKHCERLFFVEYKNGNVVAKNGQTNEITLKSKPATNIEKKLYDSVLMLEYEGLINLAVSRNQCIALVVVRNDAVPRSEAEADSLQPTANPVFPQLMRTADEFNIRSAAGLAEKLYLAVKVVIVDIFERDYLPHLEVCSIDTRITINTHTV